jgi:competence protein CoiA
MLTCKIGENIINCFDGTYDKYQLKKWSDKNILICPDCGKPYEYCHGRIITPYFRHKEKNIECGGKYSEPETEEHIKGKLILYNWLIKLQDLGVIKNVKLETYIPETKQRPDLYFEKDNLRNVIELQCSPIASEYLERHELYKLANVNDIWILGLNKYNIKLTDGEIVQIKSRQRIIEENSNYYLNVDSSELLMDRRIIIPKLPYYKLELNPFIKCNIENLHIDNKEIVLNNETLNSFIEKDIKIYQIVDKSKELTNFLNNRYFNILNKKCFYQNNWEYSPYLSKITFYYKNEVLEFYINRKSIDCCVSYEVSVPFIGKRGGLGWHKYTKYNTLFSKTYEIVDIDIIKDFILKIVSNFVRNEKYKKGGK